VTGTGLPHCQRGFCPAHAGRVGLAVNTTTLDAARPSGGAWWQGVRFKTLLRGGRPRTLRRGLVAKGRGTTRWGGGIPFLTRRRVEPLSGWHRPEASGRLVNRVRGSTSRKTFNAVRRTFRFPPGPRPGGDAGTGGRRFLTGTARDVRRPRPPDVPTAGTAGPGPGGPARGRPGRVGRPTENLVAALGRALTAGPVEPRRPRWLVTTFFPATGGGGRLADRVTRT